MSWSTSRFELKYRINAEQANAIRAAAGSLLAPDSNGVDAMYRITSAYFDTSGLDAYWEKRDGVLLRKKVRLRFYGNPQDESDFDSSAGFLEIKHRDNHCIFKERVPLSAQGTRDILHDSRRLANIEEFLADPSDAEARICSNLRAIATASGGLFPVVTISYKRQAWLGVQDDRLRVTFDHCCVALPPNDYLGITEESGTPLLPPESIVLEVKFNHAIPRWIRDILIETKCQQERISKYAFGLDALGRHESDAAR